MKRWLTFPSVQIALCLLVYGLAGWRGGPFVLVWSAPLLAALIARPTLNLIANIRGAAREHVWLPKHGNHYVFKGVTIHVQEDDDRCRWVCLADVRKVVGETASEGALARTYPGRLQPMGDPARPYLRDDALLEHLRKESKPAALKLRAWTEANIARPGQRIRDGLGIRLPAAGRSDSP